MKTRNILGMFILFKRKTNQMQEEKNTSCDSNIIFVVCLPLIGHITINIPDRMLSVHVSHTVV